MTAEFSPGIILLIGVCLIPFLSGIIRGAYMILLPLAVSAYVLTLAHGEFGHVILSELPLTTLRVDKLSLLFSYVFLIAVTFCVIYSLHVRDTLQHMAGLAYAAGAIGAVFAGDLFTFFFFWEVMTLASVFLIWAAGSGSAYRAGMRYLVVQVISGLFLFSGISIHYHETGSLAFDALDLDGLGPKLIFVAFGIKAAFPLLHNWLQDAYPEATVTGTVFLSAFTTKVAIYALARGFAGTDILIPIGAVMAVFPIFYAVIENDLRRVLAYGLNNQLGFMVVGVGIGTELALNGVAAHAFSHVLYKSLLFMSVGAVLYRVGTAKASELGGLYKSMPWTAGFCIIGVAAISAPLFSSFVSKSMIISAAMETGHSWLWLVLLIGSAGVFVYSGLKVPYFAFFAKDSGKRCEEAPRNMLAAMAIVSLLCVAVGVYPQFLYGLLPYPVDYHPYSLEHVVTQLQLLAFSVLAFTVLMRYGIYPPELRSTNLDTDWFYRRAGKCAARKAVGILQETWQAVSGLVGRNSRALVHRLHHYHGPGGLLARTWQTSQMAFWTSVVLGAYLLFFYL